MEVPTFADHLSQLYETEEYCGQVRSEMVVVNLSSLSEETEVEFASYDEDKKVINVQSEDHRLAGKVFKFKVRLWLEDYREIDFTYELFRVSFKEYTTDVSDSETNEEENNDNESSASVDVSPDAQTIAESSSD